MGIHQSLGLSVEQMTLAFMTLVILAFTAINYRGASETGTVGNVVTMLKIVIPGPFVIFGVVVMLRTQAWHVRFTTGFMPNGPLGVLVAMGLTFIAFEGYETSPNPGKRRSIPDALLERPCPQTHPTLPC